jgi:uncharacterized damage-inducible protein DinB
MDRLQRLRRLISYDHWATRETLASMRSAAGLPDKSLKVVAHILGAERVWLDRLRESKQSLPVWPELTLVRCRELVAELETGWDDFLDELSPADFEREIAYVNSKGERWSSSVSDILNHVLLHSAYHRGQIASDLRASGAEPALTDFIHAVRTGLLS